jgi:serine/threonine protein kinase
LAVSVVTAVQQLLEKKKMRKYRLVAKKGEGTFSEVLKAQNVKDGRYHAIKCMKNRFDSIDQVRGK